MLPASELTSKCIKSFTEINNKAKFTCFYCKMVMTKRAVEPNGFLCSLIGLLTELIAGRTTARSPDLQPDKVLQMEKDIISIKEELKQLKSRSVAVRSTATNEFRVSKQYEEDPEHRGKIYHPENSAYRY